MQELLSVISEYPYKSFFILASICLVLILVVEWAVNMDKNEKIRGKLYSQLKIDIVTRKLEDKEDVYHLKGVIDEIDYNIQVTKSEYEKIKRYYEETKK